MGNKVQVKASYMLGTSITLNASSVIDQLIDNRKVDLQEFIIAMFESLPLESQIALTKRFVCDNYKEMSDGTTWDIVKEEE